MTVPRQMKQMKQIFVCATPGEGRCGEKGGGELLERFREEISRSGYSQETVLRNSCTRRHEEGPVVFIFPDDVWYKRVMLEDVPEIVERHLGAREESFSRSAGLNAD